MRITVVGCGDAFGSGGRFNAATLVEAGESCCLVDCGASTMTAINRLGIDPARIELILITHLHGDHFGGLPFLLLDAQWVRARTRPLVIAGPPGTRRRLRRAIDVLFAGVAEGTAWTFPWRVVEITPGKPVTLCGFSILTAAVIHPSGAPSTALRLEAGGRVFAHSGDTEWCEALPQIARGADLFFLECFATEPTPTHLDYETLTARRSLFDARRIVLTHMGRDMLARLDTIDRSLFDAAEDGQVYEL